MLSKDELKRCWDEMHKAELPTGRCKLERWLCTFKVITCNQEFSSDIDMYDLMLVPWSCNLLLSLCIQNYFYKI